MHISGVRLWEMNEEAKIIKSAIVVKMDMSKMLLKIMHTAFDVLRINFSLLFLS